MKFYKKFVFLVLAVMMLLACSDRASKEKPEGETPASAKAYEIVFSFPGDDFASRHDILTIDWIKTQITKEGIGEVLRIGSGMGYMSMVFKPKDGSSLDSLKKIVLELYPEARYRIESAETMGVNAGQ